MKPLAATGLLLACASLGGCATGATSSAFVDPSRYEQYNCQQLNDARKVSFDRVSELQGLMAKAETGAAGTLISGLAYQTDYVKARADLNLVDETRQRGHCGELVPEGPAAPAAATPAKKRKRSSAQ
ncbi:MAG: twin-arginine translocation pathway signal [Xanthobacteraceae bacterium]|nr:twin-arginine translocation pathway signal [Xanthobacteraceae bacterium]